MSGDRGAQAFGDLRGLPGGGGRQQGDEFFAADPERPVLAAQAIAHRLRQRDQHLVADGMAEGVVDALEVIQVQGDDGERGLLFRVLRKRLVQRPAVHQAGHRVRLGLAVQASHLAPMLGQGGLDRLAQRVGFRIPGVEPVQVLAGIRAGGHGAREPRQGRGDGIGQGAYQQQRQQERRDREAQRFRQQGAQRGKDLIEGALGHDRPIAFLQGGVADQHRVALRIFQRRRSRFADRRESG
ncbi:hypothetical protein D9M68_723410 [compost metagenome]